MATTSQPTVQSLGIDRLSVLDRMRLMEEIWDSIAAEGGSADVPQWHKDELDRRLAAMADDPHAGSTWEEANARLRKAE